MIPTNQPNEGAAEKGNGKLNASQVKYQTEDVEIGHSVTQLKLVTTWMLVVLSILVIFTGSFDSIASKLMNRQRVYVTPEATEKTNFEAPLFQTWTMYIGEALCLLIYFIDRWIAAYRNKKPKLQFTTTAASFNKPPCPRVYWCIPATLDFCATFLFQYATVLAQASTVTLLRNFNVMVCAILSIIFIRVALRMNQIVGMVVLTLGLVLTGVYAILNPDTETNYGDLAGVAIVMALVGTFFNAAQNIVEESLFRKYKASPLEAVGTEGVFGFVLGLLLLYIFQVIPSKSLEKSSEVFYTMSQGNYESTVLIVSNIAFVISVCTFNATGLIVTKVASCLLRVILMAARTVSVWVVELAAGWSSFSWFNFSGMILVFIGILTYNYNYFIPVDSFSWDRRIRKPIFCFSFLKDPDVEEAKASIPITNMREKSFVSDMK